MNYECRMMIIRSCDYITNYRNMSSPRPCGGRQSSGLSPRNSCLSSEAKKERGCDWGCRLRRNLSALCQLHCYNHRNILPQLLITNYSLLIILYLNPPRHRLQIQSKLQILIIPMLQNNISGIIYRPQGRKYNNITDTTRTELPID